MKNGRHEVNDSAERSDASSDAAAVVMMLGTHWVDVCVLSLFLLRARAHSRLSRAMRPVWNRSVNKK